MASPSFFQQRCPVVSTKQVLLIMVALLNGILYGLTIPRAGAENIEKLAGTSGNTVDKWVFALCACAGLCYTMFYYKTLESLNFNSPDRTRLLASSLAPFSALGYLTGGTEGAELSFATAPSAVIGSTLYAFRILSCVDASFKLPTRLQEIKSSWIQARAEKNFPELFRLAVTVVFSLMYALASTDAIYAAAEILSGWLDLSKRDTTVLSYFSSAVGAIGIFPLILYWIHRGLKQLTGGGVVNENGENPDPTDRYTFLGLMFVAPNFLGVVGAAASEEASVLSSLGLTADFMRISSSAVYAITSGTPGVATLLRSLFKSSTPKKPYQLVSIDEMESDNSKTPLLTK